jgi:hypothetical protein
MTEVWDVMVGFPSEIPSRWKAVDVHSALRRVSLHRAEIGARNPGVR